MRILQMKQTARQAFRVSLPVLLGYLFVGIAYGLLLQNAGYGPLWAALTSLLVYAGSMQFVLVGFLGGGASLAAAALMTLAINARHLFYGVSMLDKFKNTGKKKWYMVFALSDETYSLLCGAAVPPGADKGFFYFFICLFDQLYWIAGSVLGSVCGKIIPFNTTGIDFAMTALFLVICVDLWKGAKSHAPALAGLISGFLCLLLFGKDNFVIPALVAILLALSAFYRPLAPKLLENLDAKGGGFDA